MTFLKPIAGVCLGFALFSALQAVGCTPCRNISSPATPMPACRS